MNAQGRVLADINILALPDSILLDTEPETREKVYAHLDQYIIADDVTLEDITGQMSAVGLEGPKASEILGGLGAPVPSASHESSEWGNRLVSRISVTGADGFRIFVPVEDEQMVVEQLRAAGAVPADEDDIRAVRLEHGHARYGEDVSDKYLPHEAQLLHALHFNKGCYLGQEIVERVRSRGQVHRLLVPIRIETDQPPAPGSELTVDGAKAGEITSAAFSPALGQVVALAYVRHGYEQPGSHLRYADAAVIVGSSKTT